MREKIITHASSFENGIIFYSRIAPRVGIKTYYDENDNINVKSTLIEKEIMECYNKYLDENPRILYTIVFTIILISGLIICSYTGSITCFLLTNYIIYTSMYEDVINIIKSIIDYKTPNGKKRTVARFHAAEHKAINAYNKKHGIPTFEEVEKESRLSKHCGSLILFNEIFCKTLMCTILFCISQNAKKISDLIKQLLVTCGVEGIRYYIAVASIIVLILLLISMVYLIIKHIVKNYAVLSFMEVLYTEKPTAREINLAIKGIEYYEWHEKLFKKKE